jgi:hypothetical protein
MQVTYSDELLRILQEKKNIENDTLYNHEEKQKLLTIISTYFIYKYSSEQIESKKTQYGNLVNEFMKLEYPNADSFDGVEFGALAGQKIEESRTLEEIRRQNPNYSLYNYDNFDYNFKYSAMALEPENIVLVKSAEMIEKLFDIRRDENRQIDRVARGLNPVLGNTIIERNKQEMGVGSNDGQSHLVEHEKTIEEYQQCFKQALSEVQGLSLIAPTVSQYLNEMVNMTFNQYMNGQNPIIVQKQFVGKSY